MTDDEHADFLHRAVLDTCKHISTLCEGNPVNALMVAAITTATFAAVADDKTAAQECVVEIIDDIISGRAFVDRKQ
jgi:hypothetical protein